MSNWTAHKSNRSLGWIVYWDLFDEKEQPVGQLLRNTTDKGFWTATAYSRQTGLSLGSKMFPGMSLENRALALAWVKETVTDDPMLTKDQLKDLIQLLKNNKYMDEMSDDFAYSNGKVDRWNKEIKRLENMYKTFN